MHTLASQTKDSIEDVDSATFVKDLRQRANQLVGGKVVLSLDEMVKMTPEDTRRIFHELAPVGYCALSEEGLILQINLTAVTLLGMNRKALVQKPIFRFIYREDRDIYYLLCQQLLAMGYAGTLVPFIYSRFLKKK